MKEKTLRDEMAMAALPVVMDSYPSWAFTDPGKSNPRLILEYL